MARGGFHGGGHHTGGHHSGGFHGGGFHGGGFSGGGFRSGGTHFRTYSGSSSYSDNEWFGFLLNIGIRIGLPLCLYIIYLIAEDCIPGMNLLNLVIFVVSGVLFFITLKQYKRTIATKAVNTPYRVTNFSYVWKDATCEKSDRTRDRNTWVETYGKGYQIAFSDGKENIRIVKETLDRTPRIIWVSPYIWLFIGILIFFINFGFYEILILFFENINMPDAAFKFIDEFLFYLPSVLTLACAVTCFVSMKIKDALLYKCAIRIINNNKAIDKRIATEEFIASRMEAKWYYDTCPNCGAEASHVRRVCLFCGSSLEVLNPEKCIEELAHHLPTED